MRILSYIFVTALMLSCSTETLESVSIEKTEGQSKLDSTKQFLWQVWDVLIEELEVPQWIEGNWSNNGELNKDEVVTYNFAKDYLYINLGHPSVQHKTTSPLSHYSIHEHVTDGLYRIDFTKDEYSEVYEFRFFKMENGNDSYLTYFHSKDGLVLNEHNDRKNIILTRN